MTYYSLFVQSICHNFYKSNLDKNARSFVMKKLKALEWNIRAAAAVGWDNDYDIKPWIVDMITSNDYDIVILNEFAISNGWDYCQCQLKENGYVWVMTYTSYENGILIAIKKDTFHIKHRKDVIVTEQIDNSNNGCIELPDFLAITVIC